MHVHAFADVLVALQLQFAVVLSIGSLLYSSVQS